MGILNSAELAETAFITHAALITAIGVSVLILEVAGIIGWLGGTLIERFATKTVPNMVLKLRPRETYSEPDFRI